MSPFRRIVVLAGVPLGAAVAGATAFRSPTNWWDLFLTGLGASVVIGGALASVAHLFIRRVRRSAWTVFLFLVVIALSGLFAGLGAYAGAGVIPHGRWTRIPSPPEPVTGFLGPTCYSVGTDGPVYARATSGRLYAFRLTAGEQETWTRADSIPAPDSSGECARSAPNTGWTPLKVGTVAATYQIEFRGVDCGGRTHYRLLQNGTMWRWGTGACAIGEAIILLAYLVFVLVVTLLVACAALVLRPPFGWPISAAGTSPVAA